MNNQLSKIVSSDQDVTLMPANKIGTNYRLESRTMDLKQCHACGRSFCVVSAKVIIERLIGNQTSPWLLVDIGSKSDAETFSVVCRQGPEFNFHCNDPCEQKDIIARPYLMKIPPEARTRLKGLRVPAVGLLVLGVGWWSFVVWWRIELWLDKQDLLSQADIYQRVPVTTNRTTEENPIVVYGGLSRRKRPQHTALFTSPHRRLHEDDGNFIMRKDQYRDLQAPTPSDPHCRRRAFHLIALLYGAAGLADIACRCLS